ncbi:Uncharacterised protein [Shigella flexneri]|nr:Uncharacterised protein [Shigella flexneri]
MFQVSDLRPAQAQRIHQMTNRALFHTRLTGQHNIIAIQTKSCRQRTHCRSGVTEEQLQGTFCV